MHVHALKPYDLSLKGFEMHEINYGVPRQSPSM